MIAPVASLVSQPVPWAPATSIVVNLPSGVRRSRAWHRRVKVFPDDLPLRVDVRGYGAQVRPCASARDIKLREPAVGGAQEAMIPIVRIHIEPYDRPLRVDGFGESALAGPRAGEGSVDRLEPAVWACGRIRETRCSSQYSFP